MEELKLSECKWPEVYISIPKEIAEESLQYQNKMTAVEKIIEEIDNELQTLSLHGKEIFGRKVGLAFAKRVAEQAKEIEKEQILNAFCDG
jgi:predicted negative regulator of RcsB-dependent stress response